MYTRRKSVCKIYRYMQNISSEDFLFKDLTRKWFVYNNMTVVTYKDMSFHFMQRKLHFPSCCIKHLSILRITQHEVWPHWPILENCIPSAAFAISSETHQSQPRPCSEGFSSQYEKMGASNRKTQRIVSSVWGSADGGGIGLATGSLIF